MARLRSLRIVSIVTVVLLALQFELGMAVNLSPSLEGVPPLAGTPAAVWAALVKVGAGAPAHALLGILLSVIALASLAIALWSGATAIAITGMVSFMTIASAAVNGVLFTLSGFKNDNYSHGMATTFLLAFSTQFVQIGILTMELRRQRSEERPLQADRK